jgi:RHS repeat-associated protein
VPNPRAFGNQPLNTHTQLVDMGARLYDRDQGRFLQADPIIDPATPDSMNGYTYASGDPVNGTDFSGLMAAHYAIDGGGGSSGDPSSAGAATSPSSEPSNVLERALKTGVKKATPIVFIASLLTPWGQQKAAGMIVDAAKQAWNAGSAYVTSIPGKTPAELWADYNAFTGGQVVGALSILGDLAQQVSSPVDDLKYVFLNVPQPPSSSEVLGSVAAWAGIKTNSTPYKAGVITGQIEGTIALTALTGGAGGASGAARAGTVGAKAAAGADDLVTLWRTVGPEEAASIFGTGRYAYGPTEFKYFFANVEDAIFVGKWKIHGTGEPQTMTTGQIPRSALSGARPHVSAGEGPGWVTEEGDGIMEKIRNVLNIGPVE